MTTSERMFIKLSFIWNFIAFKVDIISMKMCKIVMNFICLSTKSDIYLITSATWTPFSPFTTKDGLVFSLVDGDSISVSMAGGREGVAADWAALFSSFCSFLGGGAVSSGGNVSMMGRLLEVSSFTCKIQSYRKVPKFSDTY